MCKSEIKELAKDMYHWGILKHLIRDGYEYPEALIALINALELDQADIEQLVDDHKRKDK